MKSRGLAPVFPVLFAGMFASRITAQIPVAPPQPPPTYTLTDLGPMSITAAPSGPTALNASNQVTGFRSENFATVCGASNANRAFLWNNGVFTELGTLGGYSSFAYGINNAGQIAGMSDPCPNGVSIGLRAFVWQNGTMVSLDPSTSASTSTYGLAINSNGSIVGYNTSYTALIWRAVTIAPSPTGAVRSNSVVTITTTAAHNFAVGDAVTVASVADPSFNGSFTIASVPSPTTFTYSQSALTASSGTGTVWDALTLPSLTCQFTTCNAKVLAINDAGQAAGWGQGPYVHGSTMSYNASQAVMWNANGQAIGLGSLGNYYSDQANAINSNGDVAGYSYLDPGISPSTVHAVIWHHGNLQAPQDLGAIPGTNPFFTNLPPDNCSSAWGINSSGDVVGISAYGAQAPTQGNGGRAFLYSGGTMYDLTSLLAPGTNWKRLEAAWAINDSGQIVGVGLDPNGQEHGFLLTPVIVPTATTIASSANPSVSGQQVTFTATISPAQPSSLTPTGNVTFSDRASALGTAALSFGSATFTSSGLKAGTHGITASYGGDSHFGSSTSSILTQTVNQAATSTTLTASPNPANMGQPVTLTATINVVTPGTGTPTGTVTFLDGTATLGTSIVNGSGAATFSTSSLSVGPHSFTASYGGDVNFAGSVSAVTGLTVVLPPPTLASPASGPTTTNPSVTLSGTGAPGATVTILDGTTAAGTTTVASAGTYAAAITLAIGVHSLTATQSLNGATSAASPSVTITVAPPAPVITSPAPGLATANPSVTVSGTGVAGASVTILDGTTAVGTATVNTVGTFAATITFPVGSHSLTATQTINGIASAASTAVTITIQLPPVSITVNESIKVSDAMSFPDVFDAEKIKVTDTTWITPLIQVSAAVAEFSAGSLGFGGQGGTQTITVSNIGRAPLALSSAVLSGGSQFAITQTSCSSLGATSLPTSLPPGGACAFTVAYTASATPTTDTGTLTFTDNAGLSNVANIQSGSNYVQSIALTGSGTTTPPPPPPPAVVPITVSEKIHVTDAVSFPDAFDAEKITVTDQVSIQVLNTTATSITIGGTDVYGSPTTVNVSVTSQTAIVSGHVTLTLDGGTPSSMPLDKSGSATFNLGILKAGAHAVAANFAAQGAFLASSTAAKFSIIPATPTITWPTPAPITYGTPLSSTQLNATASTAGAFTYNPAAGTALPPGVQTLSVAFVPADAIDYTNATATVKLQVLCGGLITVSPTTVPVGGIIRATGRLLSCSTTTQNLVLRFMLSGPAQPNTCSPTRSLLLTTPPVPIAPGASQTISFPLPIAAAVCPGTYSIGTDTLLNGVVISRSTASLTITAH